ncbi:MAG: hypothetical protein PHT40_03365 [Patescibacteria group bacterium]|nr:hypothetical protein [Patescibacteria group bacterium]
MATKLSLDAVKKILQSVKEGRKATRVELGKRQWSYKHCNMYMVLVKVWINEVNDPFPECNIHSRPRSLEVRARDEYVCVCPKCRYHFHDKNTSPSPDYEYYQTVYNYDE